MDEKVLKEIREKIDCSICYYEETYFGFVLHNKQGFKRLCSKDLSKVSKIFDGYFKVSKLARGIATLYNQNKRKRICRLSDMQCSPLFSGGWRKNEDGTIVYWNKPEETVWEIE